MLRRRALLEGRLDGVGWVQGMQVDADVLGYGSVGDPLLGQDRGDELFWKHVGGWASEGDRRADQTRSRCRLDSCLPREHREEVQKCKSQWWRRRTVSRPASRASSQKIVDRRRIK